jgi:MYXO-CTERM domain-containing protein
MNGTAQLTFGLDDLLSPNAEIIIGGNLFANGTINIENLGGLGAGVYDLMSVSGTFTDNGLALGSLPNGFNGTIYSVELLLPTSGSMNGIVQLSIEFVPAPEPGSATLLGLALLGAACFRRRRKAAVVSQLA